MKTWMKIVGGIVVLAGVGFAALYFGKQLGVKEVVSDEETLPLNTSASPVYSEEPVELPVLTQPDLRNTVSDAAVVVLSEKVDEIGDSETAQRVVKEVLNGELPPGDINREVVADIAVDVLAEQIEEIGESETAKRVLKDLAGGGASDTNAPSPTTTDIAVDILGEQVDEVGESELLKDVLKGLGNSFFK